MAEDDGQTGTDNDVDRVETDPGADTAADTDAGTDAGDSAGDGGSPAEDVDTATAAAPSPPDVDRPADPAPALAGRIVAPGLPAAARQRLEDLGPDLTVDDGLDQLASADVVLMSTRTPRAELTAALDACADVDVPVLALTHTGGESAAVDILRRGGTGVIAEGNEGDLAAYLHDQHGHEGLVESYDRSFARTDPAQQSTLGRDPVTGLADSTALDARLAALEQDGTLPRLVLVRVVRTPLVPDEVSADAAAMVRRRLANQFANLTRTYLADMYWTTGWDFVVVGLDLTADDAQALGEAMDRVAVCYAPTGATPLGVAVGHAGPEVSEDVAALRESAQRALDVAAADRSRVTVNAATMARGVSSTTELEAALKAIEHVDALTGSDSRRVGEIAGAVATELGYDGIARSRVQLAAHLHAIGMAALPADIVSDGPDTPDSDAAARYRDYPRRSADYLRVPAGPEVADIVVAHRERFDGEGFPAGTTGRDIPIGARIVAVARATEALERAGATRAEMLTRLAELAGTELDGDVVDAVGSALR